MMLKIVFTALAFTILTVRAVTMTPALADEITAINPVLAMAQKRKDTKKMDTSKIEPPKVSRSGFTRDDFEQFAEMRIGTGDPVYWYGFGVISRYPDGKELARVEGVDLGRLYRPDPDVPSVHMYTRKFIVFRDPETNEIMRDADGKMRFVGFNYQFFRWHLDGDVLHFEAEQGVGDQVFTVPGGRESEIRRIGDLTTITTPVYVESPIGDWWEKYDFTISHSATQEPRYQSVWSSYRPAFSFMEEGKITMHMWSLRYDAYEDMPESLRTVIENEPGMILWKEPPKDIDEIRELQRTGESYR